MSVSKDQAKKLLQRQVEGIAELKTKKFDTPDLEPWRQQTLRIIKRVFGEQSDHEKQFGSIEFGFVTIVAGMPESAFGKAYERGLARAESTLRSFVDELDLFESSPSMECPKCNNHEVTFLTIDEVGSQKYKLAIPQVAGVEWERGKKAAFFMCGTCQCVFYTEPFKH